MYHILGLVEQDLQSIWNAIQELPARIANPLAQKLIPQFVAHGVMPHPQTGQLMPRTSVLVPIEAGFPPSQAPVPAKPALMESAVAQPERPASQPLPPIQHDALDVVEHPEPVKPVLTRVKAPDIPKGREGVIQPDEPLL